MAAFQTELLPPLLVSEARLFARAPSPNKVSSGETMPKGDAVTLDASPPEVDVATEDEAGGCLSEDVVSNGEDAGGEYDATCEVQACLLSATGIMDPSGKGCKAQPSACCCVALGGDRGFDDEKEVWGVYRADSAGAWEPGGVIELCVTVLLPLLAEAVKQLSPVPFLALPPPASSVAKIESVSLSSSPYSGDCCLPLPHPTPFSAALSCVAAKPTSLAPPENDGVCEGERERGDWWREREAGKLFVGEAQVGRGDEDSKGEGRLLPLLSDR
mmetsp:Transcript_13852/g.34831  ORF Transcript_13852/g.34831 Transcript_13852/m.34831 type:complete len:272 (+) Transcript_13852:265-1080(+)